MPASPIHGRYDPAFQAVADAFERNFSEHGEVGAGVSLTVEGETVVDLWGGHRDMDRTDEWQADTVCVVFSCTKAATAICAHILADRGALDLDAPIASIWPEFAQAGKEDALVRHTLDHSVGLPAIREQLQRGDAYDWNAMAARLAAQAPFWPPGERHGYHMTSFGWLVGEIVRRTAGMSLGEFFAQEIASPLGIDFQIGVAEYPAERLARVELYRPNGGDARTDFAEAVMRDPNGLHYLALLNTGTGSPNSPDFQAAQLGGHGGVANARAMAGMMAPLANAADAHAPQLVSKQRVDAMRRPVSVGGDATLLIPTAFGEGFMLRMDNRATHRQEGHSLLIGVGAFGHVGLGGSVCFADPDCRMSFGYAMNRHGGGLLANDRGHGLIDAAYASAGAPLPA